MTVTKDEIKRVRTIVFHADAFRMSFKMARIVHHRLCDTLVSIEPKFAATGTFDDEIASAFCDAWCLVDIFHRVRDLAQQSRLVIKRHPDVQVFLRKTKPAEDLRHFVQHFRSGIHELPNRARPLFGTLSWVSSTDSQKCFSIVSGTLADGIESYGATYDRKEQRYCQKIFLAAGTTDIDLDDALNALQRFHTHLEKHLGSKGAGSLMVSPLGLAMHIQVKVGGQSVAKL